MMKPVIRGWSAWLRSIGALGGAVLLAAAPAVFAKPIEVVVPIAPGGSTDSLSRVVADELAKRLGEPVIVVSKPGAGITVAARYVAAEPADGRTLFMGTAVFSIIPFQKTIPFDYNAFAPIVPIYTTPSVLYVRASMPVNTVREFIDWAKANPKGVSFGSTGIGGATHIDAEAFASAAGFKMIHVPYAGSAATFPAMAGDHIDAAFGSPSQRGQIAKGARVKALMVGSGKPLADWPELPAVDASLLGNFRAENWAGIFVLAKTPAAVQDKLNADLNTVLSAPAIKERFTSFSVAPVGGTRDAFVNFINADRTRLGAIIKARNIPLE